MTGPHRIQRKRTRGWRMPAGAVYVGRPSRWGNPFVVGVKYPIKNTGRVVGWKVFDDVEAIVKAYRNLIYLNFSPKELGVLRGKDLVCWCALNQPCHADVLLELANAPEGAP